MLDDHTTAPIDEKLRAALGMLRKVTLAPDELSADDMRQLVAARLSRGAIIDALYVGFLFNVYDRLADTLGWDVPVQAAFDAGANSLIRRGYQ